jgi:hypothetical protein
MPCSRSSARNAHYRSLGVYHDSALRLLWTESCCRGSAAISRPTGSRAGGAHDAFSTFLHLIVNWLEIDAVCRFIERDRVVGHDASLHFYRWIYRAVMTTVNGSKHDIASTPCSRFGPRPKCPQTTSDWPAWSMRPAPERPARTF